MDGGTRRGHPQSTWNLAGQGMCKEGVWYGGSYTQSSNRQRMEDVLDWIGFIYYTSIARSTENILVCMAVMCTLGAL